MLNYVVSPCIYVTQRKSHRNVVDERFSLCLAKNKYFLFKQLTYFFRVLYPRACQWNGITKPALSVRSSICQRAVGSWNSHMCILTITKTANNKRKIKLKIYSVSVQDTCFPFTLLPSDTDRTLPVRVRLANDPIASIFKGIL